MAPESVERAAGDPTRPNSLRFEAGEVVSVLPVVGRPDRPLAWGED